MIRPQLNMSQGMDKALTKDGSTMSQTSLGKKEHVVTLLERLATHIFELTTLEEVPYPFLRIEIGCIGRQAFQMKTRDATFRQKVLDPLGAMDACTIPA